MNVETLTFFPIPPLLEALNAPVSLLARQQSLAFLPIRGLLVGPTTKSWT